LTDVVAHEFRESRRTIGSIVLNFIVYSERI
jgi:hypothetical protein